jgi:hypothetical protein
MCLLYADDALLLMQPCPQQIKLFKVVLQIFQEISGLKINLDKSEILVIADNAGQGQRLTHILQCRVSNFPITYLGLPLSDKKLTRAAYLPLIQQEEARLP